MQYVRVAREVAGVYQDARWLADWAKKEFGGKVRLVSEGPRLSVAARLAAVQADSIAEVKLHEPMKSLKGIIEDNRGANHFPEMMCFGLLEHFDLPQIEALIVPRKVLR